VNPYTHDLRDLDPEFKDLFMKLVKKNPEERISLGEVKKHGWFKGEVYSKEELGEKMKEYYDDFE